MNRVLRIVAFVFVISALGGLAGLSVATLRDAQQSTLQAQVASGPVFSQGGSISVQPNRQTFAFCNLSSRSVPITASQGTVQIYEFAGYEWALAITQPGAPQSALFPGRSLTMVNGTRQGESSLTQIQPGKLYFITSSVPLTINCAAGTMNGNAAGEGNANCPIPSCAQPPRDCAWSREQDANGCWTCGSLVCVPGSNTGGGRGAETSSTSCPSGFSCLIRGSTSPPDSSARVAWECGFGTSARQENGPTCGSASDPGVCVRCVTNTGTTGSTGTSGSRPATCASGFSCLIRGSTSPPDSQYRVAWECGMNGQYEQETSGTCGAANDPGSCVRCVPKTGTTGTTGTTGAQCPTPSCAQPPIGCFWSMGTGADGCPTCGRIACT